MHNKPDHKEFVSNLAFATEQMGACTLLDLFGDPYIGGKVQDYLAPAFKGQEMHARKAEFAGDASAIVVFMGAQKYMPGLTRGIKKATQGVLNPLYEKIGQNRLQDWAKRHEVDPKSPEFRAKLDEWKEMQTENFAKASLLAGASVATNVAIQVALGNPRPVSAITIGKVAGATVTLGATMGIRALAPHTMHRFDEKVRDYIVAPALNATQKLFGFEPGELPTTNELDMPMEKKDFRTRVDVAKGDGKARG